MPVLVERLQKGQVKHSESNRDRESETSITVQSLWESGENIRKIESVRLGDNSLLENGRVWDTKYGWRSYHIRRWKKQ